MLRLALLGSDGVAAGGSVAGSEAGASPEVRRLPVPKREEILGVLELELGRNYVSSEETRTFRSFSLNIVNLLSSPHDILFVSSPWLPIDAAEGEKWLASAAMRLHTETGLSPFTAHLIDVWYVSFPRD